MSASAVGDVTSVLDAPGVHHGIALGKSERELDVLLDEQDAHLPRGVELGDGVLDLHDDRRLDAFGRLVEHEHLRTGHQGPGDRQLLGLPTGQQTGGPAHHRGKGREQVDGLVDRPDVAAALALEDDVQVLAHRQRREDLVALGHVAEPHPGPLEARLLGDVLSVERGPGPTSDGSRPITVFSNVDLPTPLRPIRQVSEPLSTFSDTSNTTCVRP